MLKLEERAEEQINYDAQVAYVGEFSRDELPDGVLLHAQTQGALLEQLVAGASVAVGFIGLRRFKLHELCPAPLKSLLGARKVLGFELGLRLKRGVKPAELFAAAASA